MKLTSCLYCGDKDLTDLTVRADGNRILRCATCGLMMVADIDDRPEAIYTAEYFESQAATKIGYTDYLSSPVANMIGKYAFTRLFAGETGRHLDLGCADGSLMEIFGAAGFETYGLDISQDAVTIARGKGLNAQASPLDLFPSELPDFETITAFDLLEHVYKPGVVLRGALEHLKVGGYLVFSTLSVRQSAPTDYWFNNSLEHVAYYNHDNLTYILSDVFGAESFAFVEIEINGVAEFWGMAKKGKLGPEREIIERIATDGFDRDAPEAGYLVSLFYDQLSKFSASESIIKHFERVWPASITTRARFYHSYFQGKFERAVKDSANAKGVVSAQDGVYWQALANAQTVFSKLHEADLTEQSNAEIMSLRTQVFEAKDQLHRLKHAPVIGQIITTGLFARRAVRKAKRVARGTLSETRESARRTLPKSVRTKVKRVMSYDARARFVRTKVITNHEWASDRPLVSVIIPYFNRADTLDDTLASLAEQTFRDFETIIIDDGSTDPASVKHLDDLQAEGLGAHIIRQKNQGVATARNNGIKHARGKYIICLDSDDMLDATFIEKATIVLETSPSLSLVTSNRLDFGVTTEPVIYTPYDPLDLYVNNMVITAAEFKAEAWRVSGGYRSGIGYEDWDFWLNLAEHGFWGKVLPEQLFRYRTSMQSRYVEDKDVHWRNIELIRSLHPKYRNRIRRLQAKRQYSEQAINVPSAFVNLSDAASYSPTEKRTNILITIPWMTFGGAETLIYNYCREIGDRFNLSFVTALESKHEWEYKFKEITPNVYHMANMFSDPALHLEFISNYIATRGIQILHIIHNGFTFAMLETLKERFPELKVIVTMFNDRVEYFEQSVGFDQYIDAYVSDNSKVATHYTELVGPEKRVVVIPNGINCYDEYSPDLFNRTQVREELRIGKDELAVFFVGRLSEEKNPDVFLDAAGSLAKATGIKLRFFIVGDGPMRSAVEKQIKRIGSDNITYLGYQAKVARYLSAADIFVLPSSIEGFPLSILEAMAMRVAVVASNVGAVAEVLGDDGFVVTPGSATEITAAIKRLHDEPKLLAEIKQASRDKAEKLYSNIVLGHNYQRLYEETVE